VDEHSHCVATLRLFEQMADHDDSHSSNVQSVAKNADTAFVIEAQRKFARDHGYETLEDGFMISATTANDVSERDCGSTRVLRVPAPQKYCISICVRRKRRQREHFPQRDVRRRVKGAGHRPNLDRSDLGPLSRRLPE
jgi:hypothetical protein